VVPGARRDGAEADTALPKAARQAKAPIVPEEALVDSVPAPIDAPEVGQMRGGATEASPMDMETA